MFITSGKSIFTPVSFTGPSPTVSEDEQYNSDDYLGQNMHCVGLIRVGTLFIPVSWVLRALSLCPTELSLGCQMSLAFFTVYETIKFLRMCENFNFPTVGKHIYSSRTAINQPLTGRNGTGR